MAPKVSGAGRGRGAGDVGAGSSGQGRGAVDLTQHICAVTQRWLHPLPPNFIKDTTIFKELRRINTLVSKRFADRTYQRRPLAPEPSPEPARGVQKKTKKRVKSHCLGTLEDDNFFAEWQQPLRDLLKNRREMLDIEEYIRMTNKALILYKSAEGIKVGESVATSSAMQNIQLIVDAMHNLGLLQVVHSDGEGGDAAPDAAPLDGGWGGSLPASSSSEGPARPAAPPADPPARALDVDILEQRSLGDDTSEHQDPPARALDVYSMDEDTWGDLSEGSDMDVPV